MYVTGIMLFGCETVEKNIVGKKRKRRKSTMYVAGIMLYGCETVEKNIVGKMTKFRKSDSF